MDSLFLRDIVIYGVLILFVLYVTKQNNMWGVKKGTNKTKVESRKYKQEGRYRSYLAFILSNLANIGENFMISPSSKKIEDYQYKINRIRLRIHLLSRNIKAIELIGLFKLLKYIGVVVGTLGLFLTGNIIFLVFYILVTIEFFFIMFVDAVIMSSDREIEEDFPDLYILLYSRLIKGSSVRLLPTLDDYLRSIDTVHGENSHKEIRNFVRDIKSNIDIYGDDSMAIHKMRDMYKSAMLVNFFNLAIQSLRNVNNSEKLLAFKIELNQRKLAIKEKKAEKLVEKGQIAIWAVYIILFEFVILSWASKTNLGSFSQLFGNF